MSDISIRALDTVSLSDVAELLSCAFESGTDGVAEWTALIEREAESCRLDPSASIVALAGERIVGACLLNVGWNGFSRVGSTAVDPKAHRQGIGRLLISDALSNLGTRGAKRAVLEVDPENNAAIGLYKSHGFVDRRGLSTWSVRRSQLLSHTAVEVSAMDIAEAIELANQLERPEPAFQRSAPYIGSFSLGVRALGIKEGSSWVAVLVQRGRDILELGINPNYYNHLGALLWAATSLSWEIRLMHQVDEDPLCEVLAEAGFGVDSVAREMVKEEL